MNGRSEDLVRAAWVAAAVLWAAAALPGRALARPGADGHGRFHLDAAARRELRATVVGPPSAVARSLLFTYQRGAGPSKGTSCPMFPSCSEYARRAVAEHGVLRGVIMATDRLHRCGHDLRRYPVVAVDGWVKALDEP